MDKKHLDYFMEHFYKEDLPPRELVGAAALFERMYTNTAQLIIGENWECTIASWWDDEYKEKTDAR